MPYNKKSLQNLKRNPKGVSGNPNGRPRTLAASIKSIPPDARDKVYEVLHHALTLPNLPAAQKYLDKKFQGELGEYGFLLQVTLNSLMGKDGWITVCDILDRLWGKPKQTTQLSGGISVGDKPVIMFGEEKAECQEE